MAKYRFCRGIVSRLPRPIRALSGKSRSNPHTHSYKLEWTEPEPLKAEGQELTLRLEEGADGRSVAAGSQLQSSLMRLPRELRDQIWKECLRGMEIGIDLHAVFGKYIQVAWFPHYVQSGRLFIRHVSKRPSILGGLQNVYFSTNSSLIRLKLKLFSTWLLYYCFSNISYIF
jgi:hypothetical protein